VYKGFEKTRAVIEGTAADASAGQSNQLPSQEERSSTDEVQDYIDCRYFHMNVYGEFSSLIFMPAAQ
jgi:hypothetical protein